MTAAPRLDGSRCPECNTRGYLIWPSYGNCQTCLKLRHAFLDKVFGKPNQSEGLK